jgi:3,4-dihydroxy 2-butanone 4-phosphate synthase/GTP cyclohydrolase II
MTLSRIEDALADIRIGKMVILVDDEDRENEGDLTLAAEHVTPEAINFMATYGRGLVCLSLTRLGETAMPLRIGGDFRAIAYLDQLTGETHIALVKGEITASVPVLVRVHSECLTGDAFGSMRCDCGEQLQSALRRIEQEGSGIVLYMSQEGRGIGLGSKIKAYELQDQGFDTVEANEKLGFKADLRDYGVGAQILRDLGVVQMKLMTNNPKKIIGLEGYGLRMVERVAIEVASRTSNVRYLLTKKRKMGHLLNMV